MVKVGIPSDLYVELGYWPEVIPDETVITNFRGETQRRLNKDHRKWIGAYLAGQSIEDLSFQAGCSRATMTSFLTRYGIKVSKSVKKRRGSFRG